MKLCETIDQHPDELQVWCSRGKPPFGKGFRAWCGYAFGLIIRIFTRGPYAHVGIRLRNRMWEAIGQGVVERDIGYWNEPGLVVEAITIPLIPSQKADITAYLEAKVGTPYDFSVNLKIALDILRLPHEHIPDDLDRTLNCSGLQAHAFAHAGINLAELVKPGYPLWRFSPSDNWRLVRRGYAAYRGRVIFAEA